MGRELVLLMLPGFYGQRLEIALQHFLATSETPSEIVVVDRGAAKLEELGPPAQGTRIYSSNFPPPWLLDHARENRVDVLICTCVPAEAVEHMIEPLGGDLLASVRTISLSLALVSAFVFLDTARVVDSRAGPRDLAEALARFAAADDFYHQAGRGETGVIGSASLLMARMELLASNLASIHDQTFSDIGEKGSRIAGMTLDPFLEMINTRKRVSFVWPVELFLLGDAWHTPAKIAVDIVGPARIIYYGPYCYVPAGRWQTTAVMGFSEEITDLTFIIDIHCNGEALAVGRVKPKRGGLYEAKLEVELEHSEHPVEYIVNLETASIEGRVALGMVKFDPLDPLTEDEMLARKKLTAKKADSPRLPPQG